MILSKRHLFCIHILNSQPHLTAKRASSCISKIRNQKTVNGSVTVETALTFPFFFLAIVCLLYMMEVMVIRTNLQSGMHCAAKVIAEEAYAVSVMHVAGLEKDIVQAIGKERLDRSIVVNGSEGIQCEGSRMSSLTGIIELKVKYAVRLPVPAISDVTIPMEESLRMKGWSGYTKTGFGTNDKKIVYITENGMVYHKDYHCNYLELSIQSVPVEQLDRLRNENQGIYYACELCVNSVLHGNAYITEYGEKYHQSLGCSGLKRTIYAIPLEEAVGKGVCSKCGR